MPSSAPPSHSKQFSVYASYVGPDAPTVQTWVLPSSFAYAAATPPTPLNLPGLWTGAGSVSALAYANDDFVLGATTSGKTPDRGNVSITAQLTGNHAWNTDAASRAALRVNFLDFLVGVESTLELSNPALLVPGATAFIAASLVQNMPMPLSEVLLYGYGLETGIGTGAGASIDLVPGMRLRSEPAVRQYLAPPSQSFSGYISAGTLSWTLATSVASGAPTQAFDPFLGTIAAPQVTPPPSSPVPVYGLLDLQQSGAACRYYRLTFPQNLIAGGAPGGADAATNVQVTGADTFAAVRANPRFTGVFAGRDVLVPEIAVWLQMGTRGPDSPVELYVPVGTTLLNLLERYSRWLPLDPSQKVLSLQRLALTPAGQGKQGSQVYQSFVFAQPGAPVNDLGVFALPLLPGDHVTIDFGTA